MIAVILAALAGAFAGYWFGVVTTYRVMILTQKADAP